MPHSRWIVLAAGGLAAMAACGGSQPSAPTAPPTPDTSVAAGTHSPAREDVLYAFSNRVERLSRAESLSLSMLFESPGGNRIQDNDRDASAAASGTRTIICR